jgi:hypothetical protein
MSAVSPQAKPQSGVEMNADRILLYIGAMSSTVKQCQAVSNPSVESTSAESTPAGVDSTPQFFQLYS